MAARQTEWSQSTKHAQSCKTKPHLKAVNASFEIGTRCGLNIKKAPLRQTSFNLIWTKRDHCVFTASAEKPQESQC